MRAQKKNNDADYTVKIVIVGDSGVGKTNILCRFCDNQFKTNYVSTIGVDFKNKVIEVEGLKIRLQIWDTAGQERFKNINQTYFKGAIGVILSYSIIDSQSFSSLQGWIKQIQQHSESDVLKFLVATKCDLASERKISTEEGSKMANKYQMDFMEVSSKDGTNITSLFDRIGERVAKYVMKTANVTPNSNKRISLHKKEDQNPQGENGCKC